MVTKAQSFRKSDQYICVQEVKIHRIQQSCFRYLEQQVSYVAIVLFIYNYYYYYYPIIGAQFIFIIVKNSLVISVLFTDVYSFIYIILCIVT